MRYDRNILLEGFGQEGQAKLRTAKVLVVGAGGLGSPVLLYLAAAGVGTLGIVDYDQVDLSNLQRQLLHFTPDVGLPKVESASEKLRALNPDVQLNLYPEKLTEENAEKRIRDYDFIVECCDNYTAKFLINDVCVRLQKPYSHGAVLGWRGEVFTYLPGHACYRCIFGEPPAEGTISASAEAGVLGAVAGVIGSIQATETIKYLTGNGDLLTDRLLIFDGRPMTFQTFQVSTTCTSCLEVGS